MKSFRISTVDVRLRRAKRSVEVTQVIWNSSASAARLNNVENQANFLAACVCDLETALEITALLLI